MTVLRLVALRAGVIQAMVPQAVEAWAKEAVGMRRSRASATHQIADQLLHLGYGAFWGGLYGATLGKEGRASSLRSAGLGGGVWLIGSAVLFPVLRIAQPPWKSEPRAELVNVLAHGVYGAVTVYLLAEYAREENRQPRAQRWMQRARVG